MGSLIIISQGGNPLEVLSAIFKGALIGKGSIARSIRWITPCIIAGIAASIAFKSGVMNLGIEGQIYFGAFIAAVIGYILPLPRIIHIPITILLAGLAGIVFAIIPALLKLYYKVNEMITTLMFNYFAILLTEYLTIQLMGYSGASNPDLIATPPILPTAKLSQIIPPYQASTGIFIAMVLAFIMHLVYKYTIKGYELKQVGENMLFSKYGGIKVVKTYFTIFLLSGFIAGVTGAVELMGPHERFRTQFANNLGWDGIMIAMIAKNNPIGVVIAGFLWGILKNGSFAMERMTSVNRVVVTIIQALFVLFITIDYGKVFSSIQKAYKKKKIAKEGVNNV